MAIVFDFKTRRIINQPINEGAEMLQVRNLKEFQHYDDSRPIAWIKVYLKLLDKKKNADFAALPDAQKYHLVAIWLLAAKVGNRIPADPDWIAEQINASEPVDLEALAPWLETTRAEISASKSASNSSSKSASEKSTRERKRIEERERELECVRAPLALAHAETNPVEMWRRTFQAEPPIYIAEVISSQVEDLTAWRMTLDFWKQHSNWSPNNVTGLLNNYLKCCTWRAQITVGAGEEPAPIIEEIPAPSAEELAELEEWVRQTQEAA